MLQWGRAPEGAESRIADPLRLSRFAASMGPRPGGRGEPKLTADTGYDTDALQWGRAPEGAERFRFAQCKHLHFHASMGPRPGGRGELSSPSLTWMLGELQWGRAPEGAERARSSPGAVYGHSGFNGAAPRRARRALDRNPDSSAWLGLQWGRAPEGAERQDMFGAHARTRSLQWGRAPEGAERRSRNFVDERKGDCFNGAAPRRARRG